MNNSIKLELIENLIWRLERAYITKCRCNRLPDAKAIRMQLIRLYKGKRILIQRGV